MELVQLPLFWHGLLSHSLMSVAQFKPVNPTHENQYEEDEQFHDTKRLADYQADKEVER